MNKLALLLWIASTAAGTWWLRSEDPGLPMVPTVLFSAIVSVFLAGLATALLSALFSRASA